MKASQRWPWIVVALLALLCAPIPATVAQTNFVRQDARGGTYWEGRLSWDGARGALVDAGAGQDELDTKDRGYVDFVSAPLPGGLRPNASRHIEVNLYTKGKETGPFGTTCWAPGMGVEIYVGARLFAAMHESQEFQVAKDLFPSDPPGYGVCRKRLHPELPLLPAGSVVRLRLWPSNQVLGMAEEHQSVLRIPYFPAEELPYRYPSNAHGVPGNGVPGDALGKAFGMAGLGGLSIALTGRGRRHHTVLLLALLVVSGLGVSGCLGGVSKQADQDAPDGVRTEPLQPSYEPGNLSSAGHGSVAGTVQAADVAQPIAGAYVSLLGTTNATQTDPYGRFMFRDLQPGAYTVRVDKGGYLSFEGPVEVRRDLVARVTVFLVTIGSAGTDARPHVHDYWDGQKEITLMERVPLVAECASGFCQPVAFVVPGDTARYHSVLPGTYEVNVTIDWDAANAELRGQNVTLYFQANNDPSLTNWTLMTGHGRADPFRVQAAWEMSDPGHQRFSTWVFAVDFPALCCQNGQTAAEAALWTAQALTQTHPDLTVFATVKIVKGVVPLEPAHPDFWRGSDTLPVVAPKLKTATVNLLDSTATTNRFDLAWFPNSIIPPDTKWLEVVVTASHNDPEYQWDLRYRTAVSAPSAECWASGTYSGTHCDGEDYQHPAAATTTGLTRRWAFAVTSLEADQFYPKRSFWVFGLRAESDPANQALALADLAAHASTANTTPDFHVDYTLTVTAHRDTMPA